MYQIVFDVTLLWSNFVGENKRVIMIIIHLEAVETS